MVKDSNKVIKWQVKLNLIRYPCTFMLRLKKVLHIFCCRSTKIKSEKTFRTMFYRRMNLAYHQHSLTQLIISMNGHCVKRTPNTLLMNQKGKRTITSKVRGTKIKNPWFTQMKSPASWNVNEITLMATIVHFCQLFFFFPPPTNSLCNAVEIRIWTILTGVMVF